MKKILLSSVALVGLTAGAFAADLPSRRAPAPYVAVPVFTWTGFYAGVNAGYAFSDTSNSGRFGSFGVTPGTLTPPLAGYAGTVNVGPRASSNDGFVGGGQVGYNYQIGNLVIGVEADAQYADLDRRRSGTVTTLSGPAVPGFIGAVNSSQPGIDFFGTVRGRVGYAFDRVLVYGTGGFAYGDASRNNNQCQLADGSFAAGCSRNNNDFRTGYAAGAGVEYAFTPNIIGRIEGLYVDLDRNRATNLVGAVGGAPVYFTASSRKNDDSFGIVRAAVSYKFNTF